MLIAQVTDTHIKAAGKLAYRKVDSAAKLRDCVAHLNALDPRPDVVLLTGDLLDLGRPEEYALLREILAPLDIPMYAIPGNHDERAALRQAFADRGYLPRDSEFLHYVLEEYPVRFIGLEPISKLLSRRARVPGIGIVLRVSDEQWERIREHFPEENIPEGRAGRRPVPAREVLEAVLWILNTGAQWHMLPQCYPNHETVHRRFQQWCEREVLREVLAQLANTLRDQGEIDEEECFIDAGFASAKGGGEEIGKTRRGKGVKILAIVDRHGLPLSVSTHAANHHEVTLVQLSFDFYMIEAKPENLIGDRAYDSDGLDAELKKDGVEMIAPHRSNRRKLKTQDGRRLRRFERRWIVERFFAWLQWKRRLLIRWEYYAANFPGCVQLACITMLLRQF